MKYIRKDLHESYWNDSKNRTVRFETTLVFQQLSSDELKSLYICMCTYLLKKKTIPLVFLRELLEGDKGNWARNRIITRKCLRQ